MSIETNVHTPWNTQIFVCLNPEYAPIKQGLLDFIYQYEKQSAEDNVTGFPGHIKSNLFESNSDLFDLDAPEIDSLKMFCAHATMDVVKFVNKDVWPPDSEFSIQFHESWFHITRDGGYHDIHNHSNCSWCGIYYVELGDSGPKNGVTAFADPRAGAHGFTDFGTRYVAGRFDIPPREGTLVIFPSYVWHSAQTYFGERDRVVVAFNASIHQEKP